MEYLFHSIEMVATYFHIYESIYKHCITEVLADGEDKIPADEIIVVKGNVVDTSLEIAEAKDCDIIVMAQHTRTSLEEAFLGSTTWQLLRRSRIPILLVPLPVEE